MFKWIGIIAITAIVAVLGVQMVPVYIQNQTIKSIAQKVVTDNELASAPKRDVVKAIENGFSANSINSLKPKEVVTVNRGAAGDWVLDVKYEERRKLLYNIHIVAAFDDQITN